MKTIDLIAGARPNFMKVAPILRELRLRQRQSGGGGLDYRLVHTGQHYDRAMNSVFFEELGIPAPDVQLAGGGGNHAQQTARVMTEYDALCQSKRPDCTVVVGDVDSTLACSLVAAKLQIPLAHVEAGLRSGDRSMPEEINRLVVDAVSDIYFVTEPSGTQHLLEEGKSRTSIHEVGNLMVDTLFYQRGSSVGERGNRAEDPDRLLVYQFKKQMAERGLRYAVVTLHRPANVDDPERLAGLLQALASLSAQIPVVFPVHPRTQRALDHLRPSLGSDVHIFPPLPYMAFLDLWSDAALVLTDSGGLQEETTALGVPCLTLRDNTERPVTISNGSNQLAGTEPSQILTLARTILARDSSHIFDKPALWDGQAARRIVDRLRLFLQCE